MNTGEEVAGRGLEHQADWSDGIFGFETDIANALAEKNVKGAFFLNVSALTQASHSGVMDGRTDAAG